MNAAAAPETTALTVIERARAALAVTPERDQALAQLAAKSTGIVKITNADGYKEVHAARMVLKNERVALEKSGKIARSDAKAFADAVIAEERRLIAFIEPEEKRLQALQDAEDKRIEDEKAAKIRFEAERIGAINQRIDWIRGRVVELAGKPSAEIQEAIRILGGVPLTTDIYAEFLEQARTALTDTIAKLDAMTTLARQNEQVAAALVEQQRVIDEKQADLDRQARERAAKIKEEDDARAAKQKAEDDERAARNKAEDDERARLRRIEEDRVAAANAEAARIEAERVAEARRVEEAAAAERARARQALEGRAEPWSAIAVIRSIASGRIESDDTINPPDFEAFNAIFDTAQTVIDARAELVALDRAPAVIADATEGRR